MTRKSTSSQLSRSHSHMVEDIAVNQGDNIPDLAIDWTANEPAAGDAQVIADGDAPTVAELGQAVANLTAKLNAVLAILLDNELMADA